MVYFISKNYLENVTTNNKIKNENTVDKYFEDLSEQEKIFLTLYPGYLYNPKINIPKKTRSRHLMFRQETWSFRYI